jgi:hypothetical protein
MYEKDISMNATIINLIIQLLSSAAGGNIVGNILKQYNLGPVGNSIAGIVGGGLGGQLLNMMLGGGAAAGTAATAAAAGGLDIGSLVEQIVGGGVLMLIVGIIKQAIAGQPPKS